LTIVMPTILCHPDSKASWILTSILTESLSSDISKGMIIHFQG